MAVRAGRHCYVGVATETAYGNFHIYDIPDPTAPVLVSFYCAMAEGRRLQRRRRRGRLLCMGGDRGPGATSPLLHRRGDVSG